MTPPRSPSRRSRTPPISCRQQDPCQGRRTAEVRALKDYKGITGTINFNAKGDLSKAKYFVIQVISADPDKWSSTRSTRPWRSPPRSNTSYTRFTTETRRSTEGTEKRNEGRFGSDAWICSHHFDLFSSPCPPLHRPCLRGEIILSLIGGSMRRPLGLRTLREIVLPLGRMAVFVVGAGARLLRPDVCPRPSVPGLGGG